PARPSGSSCAAHHSRRGYHRRVPLLDVRDLRRAFYGVTALDGVNLAVRRGTITGLIGPNGAGKTTLFNCVSGLIPADGGRVIFDGVDVTGWPPHRVTARGLVRTFQIARGFPRLSVLENLMLYGARQPGETLWRAVARPPGVALRARRESGLTFLVIEHHLDVIARLCDPVIVMAEGRHLAEGTFAEVAADERVQAAYLGRRVATA